MCEKKWRGCFGDVRCNIGRQDGGSMAYLEFRAVCLDLGEPPLYHFVVLWARSAPQENFISLVGSINV